jgi:TP901 family phage tail tape measure protein
MAALPAVSDLARSGLLSLGTAGDTVVQTMAQFGLTINDAARIGDVLNRAADSTKSPVASLADSLARVGPAGRELGISLETVTAALARLQQAGIPARVAGTGLAEVFSRLADPVNGPERAVETIKALNLQLDDVHPRDFGRAVDNLAASGMTLSDATALVGREFDQLLTTLVRDRQAVVELDKSLQTAGGDSARKAAATVGTLGDSLDKLTEAKDRFFREAGKNGLSAALKAIADTGRDALNVLSGNAAAMQGASVAGHVLANAVKGAAVALAAIGANAAIAGIGRLGAAIAGAVTSMKALSAAVRANPIASFITLATAGAAAFGLFGKSADDASIKLRQLRDDAAEAEAVAKRLAQLDLDVQLGRDGAAQRKIEDLQTALGELNKAMSEGRRDVPLESLLARRNSQAPELVTSLLAVTRQMRQLGEDGKESRRGHRSLRQAVERVRAAVRHHDQVGASEPRRERFCADQRRARLPRGSEARSRRGGTGLRPAHREAGRVGAAGQGPSQGGARPRYRQAARDAGTREAGPRSPGCGLGGDSRAPTRGRARRPLGRAGEEGRVLREADERRIRLAPRSAPAGDRRPRQVRQPAQREREGRRQQEAHGGGRADPSRPAERERPVARAGLGARRAESSRRCWVPSTTRRSRRTRRSTRTRSPSWR